jgi:hypothetical protein
MNMSGPEGMPGIYMSINFEDLNNISSFGYYHLFFHPKIIFENDFRFDEGWIPKNEERTIIFNKNDTLTEFKYKFKKMYNFLKNPITLPDIMKNIIFNHQLIFPKKISFFKCTYLNTLILKLYNFSIKSLSNPKKLAAKFIVINP